ncbi:MAG: PorV/PorQ family protein, partial [Catalinimonas sp.]
DINLYSLGLAQKLGEDGALGISVTSLVWGEIEETTSQRPDGTGSTYLPQFFNIAASYSKRFSDRISGGILLRVISQSISNVSAIGVAFDAGVQYQTGVRNQFKFGVSLRNVGPKMRYTGNGLVFRSPATTGRNFDFAAERRSEAFEMPALLAIGVSYDFEFGPEHRLTAAGNFQSNSFTQDQFQIGVEYGFMEYFMARAGLDYQPGEFEFEGGEDSYIMAGPSFGATAVLPFGEPDANGNKNRSLSVDYGYQMTDFFGGNHCIGLSLRL